MKKYCFILILLSCTSALFGISSYYGLNGLNYIPLARTAEPGTCELAVSSLPAPASTLNIYPYSIRGYLTISSILEVSLTNTYQYYINHEQRFPGLTLSPPAGHPFVADTANVLAPIIPAVKLAFMDEAVPNGSLAVGIEYPYGIFLLFDYYLAFSSGFSLYGVVGLSTTIPTLYGIGGLRLDFPLPVALIIEGAYGGDTIMPTLPQEAFVSAGLLYTISHNVSLDFVFRLDADLVRRLSFGFNVQL